MTAGQLLFGPLSSVLGSIRPSTTKAFSRTIVVFNDNQGPKIEVRSTRPWPVITGLGSSEYGGPLDEEGRDFVLGRFDPPPVGRLPPSLAGSCGRLKTIPRIPSRRALGGTTFGASGSGGIRIAPDVLAQPGEASPSRAIRRASGGRATAYSVNNSA